MKQGNPQNQKIQTGLFCFFMSFKILPLRDESYFDENECAIGIGLSS